MVVVKGGRARESRLLQAASSCPDWCGSVGWVSFHRVKGRWLIPVQGTCLGGGFGPWLGCMQEAAGPCFSLTLMFFPSLSLSLKINKIF